MLIYAGNGKKSRGISLQTRIFPEYSGDAEKKHYGNQPFPYRRRDSPLSLDEVNNPGITVNPPLGGLHRRDDDQHQCPDAEHRQHEKADDDEDQQSADKRVDEQGYFEIDHLFADFVEEGGFTALHQPQNQRREQTAERNDQSGELQQLAEYGQIAFVAGGERFPSGFFFRRYGAIADVVHRSSSSVLQAKKMVEHSGFEPLTLTLPVCSFCAQNYFKNQKMWQKCDVYCLTWLPVNVILG